MATTAPGQASTPARREPEPGGWAIFAAVMLFISGTFGTIWGLAAILNDKVVSVGGRGGVIVADFTLWGWIHLVVGALMILTCFGLFAMSGWARWTAVFFATLNAVLQVGVFPAFPLWSLTAIILDVVVIYQLTVNWDTARA
jgi:hypothetical protein